MYVLNGDLHTWVLVQLVRYRVDGYRDMFRGITWYEALVSFDNDPNNMHRMFLAESPVGHGQEPAPLVDAPGQPASRTGIFRPSVDVATGQAHNALAAIVHINPRTGAATYLTAHTPSDEHITLDQWFTNQATMFHAKYPNTPVA